MYYACSVKVNPIIKNQRMVIEGSKITESCKSTPEDAYVMMIVADIS